MAGRGGKAFAVRIKGLQRFRNQLHNILDLDGIFLVDGFSAVLKHGYAVGACGGQNGRPGFTGLLYPKI